MHIQITKIANILTSSSGGPQAKYTDQCITWMEMAMYIKKFTIHDTRQKVLRKGKSNNSSAWWFSYKYEWPDT
jgi:hypothetical protein